MWPIFQHSGENGCNLQLDPTQGLNSHYLASVWLLSAVTVRDSLTLRKVSHQRWQKQQQSQLVCLVTLKWCFFFVFFLRILAVTGVVFKRLKKSVLTKNPKQAYIVETRTTINKQLCVSFLLQHHLYLTLFCENYHKATWKRWLNNVKTWNNGFTFCCINDFIFSSVAATRFRSPWQLIVQPQFSWTRAKLDRNSATRRNIGARITSWLPATWHRTPSPRSHHDLFIKHTRTGAGSLVGVQTRLSLSTHD